MEPTFDTCPEEPFRAGPGPATGRAVLGRRNAGPSAGLMTATSLVSSRSRSRGRGSSSPRTWWPGSGQFQEVMTVPV